jgi:hypothetical protein
MTVAKSYQFSSKPETVLTGTRASIDLSKKRPSATDYIYDKANILLNQAKLIS